MVSKFIATVFLLATTGRWRDLSEYLALVRELLTKPEAIIVPGKPRDKEIKKDG